MLRFEPGPPGTGFIFRRRVRAYKPERDWVATAEKQIRVMAQREIDDLTDLVTQVLEREERGYASRPRKITVRRMG
jgi:hypothetical protein